MTPYEQIKYLCQSVERPLKILIVCPDKIRRQRAIEFVINSLSSTSIFKFDASTLTTDNIAKLKNSSLNLSLFHSESSYVFKELNALSASLAAEMSEIISDKKSLNNYIVICSELAARSWLHKAFTKEQTVVFEELAAESLLKWTQAELTRAGLGKTSPQIAQKIVSLALENSDSVYTIIEKLALLSETDAVEIADLKHFEMFAEKTQEFQFINFLATANKSQALKCLNAFELSSSSAFPLMSLASKMISNYLGLKLGQLHKIPSAELIKTLSLSPWAFKKQNETAQKADLNKLVRTIQALARADSQLKNKNLGEQQILIEMVANV